MTKETKIQQVYETPQLAEFFQILGMAIAGHDEGLETYGLSMKNFAKLKLTVKKEGDLFVLKAKIKEDESVSSPVTEGNATGSSVSDQGKADYKSLKKRMKADFSELKKDLSQDKPPRAETVRRFLTDSARMLTFPGRGDEYYAEYDNRCREFQVAFDDGNLETMRSTLAVLEARKKACHNQYK